MKQVWGVAFVGLLLGLVGGLIVTWFVAPLEYYNTYPPMLDAVHRREWIRMTAWAYGLEADWSRTETRLLDLAPPEVGPTVAEVLEEATALDQPLDVLERLAEMAMAYGVSSPGVAIYTGEGVAAVVQGPVAPAPGVDPPVQSAPMVAAEVFPSPSATPWPTLVPSLTPTPAITDTPRIRIISQTLTCAPQPAIAVSLELSRTVEVRGRERQEIVGLPMREIWLLWDNAAQGAGADRAITGFRPEKGLGYADFAVTPGRSYNLYVDSPYGRPVLTIQAEPCTPEEGTGWVSRYLILRDEADAVRRMEEAPLASTALGVTTTLTGTNALTITLWPTATTPLTVTAIPTATRNITQSVTPAP